MASWIHAFWQNNSKFYYNLRVVRYSFELHTNIIWFSKSDKEQWLQERQNIVERHQPNSQQTKQ